jgi:asparagine synthase (glutamine-hydrolysing)
LKRGVQSLGVIRPAGALSKCFFAGPAETVNGLFRDGGGQVSGLVDYWRSLEPQMEKLDELGGFSLLEIRSSLPDELLMYADKLSMAHSLEARVPYLDRTVVEYASGWMRVSRSGGANANGCTAGSAKNSCRRRF